MNPTPSIVCLIPSNSRVSNHHGAILSEDASAIVRAAPCEKTVSDRDRRNQAVNAGPSLVEGLVVYEITVGDPDFGGAPTCDSAPIVERDVLSKITALDQGGGTLEKDRPPIIGEVLFEGTRHDRGLASKTVYGPPPSASSVEMLFRNTHP